MVLLVHPGTQHSYHLAKQLVRHQKLSEFWTGFGMAESTWYAQAIQNFLPERWSRKIANRIIHEVPIRFLRTKPLIGLKAIHRLHRGRPSQEVFYEINGEFQRKISSSSIKRSSAVIGFDTASWLIAESAKELGRPFFLDQSTAHPMAKELIWQAINRRFPEWQTHFEYRVPLVLEAERREQQLATKIVVASSYVKRTLVLQDIPEDKIVINPYGVDAQKFRPANRTSTNRPLRFLFLGALSALKGVPLLLEAWRELALKECELWLVGPISDNGHSLIPSLPGLKVLGKRPHGEVPELLRQCDVFIFPSYSDGFGLVLLEALASGLPVITTEASGGPDVIQEGIEGFIVQSGDLDDLCRTMKFAVENPERLRPMSEAARQCAERFTWDAYGDRWNRLLEENV